MANLPADLPENWTQGQIISPNGTEVGLTEQYGYNYLMKQVNNTQTAVNGIASDLPNVAQESSVQEIITSIGNTTDTGGTDTAGSVMGKLNTVIDRNLDASDFEDILISSVSKENVYQTEKILLEATGKYEIISLYFAVYTTLTEYDDTVSYKLEIDGNVYTLSLTGNAHNGRFLVPIPSNYYNLFTTFASPSQQSTTTNPWAGYFTNNSYSYSPTYAGIGSTSAIQNLVFMPIEPNETISLDQNYSYILNIPRRINNSIKITALPTSNSNNWACTASWCLGKLKG